MLWTTVVGFTALCPKAPWSNLDSSRDNHLIIDLVSGHTKNDGIFSSSPLFHSVGSWGCSVISLTAGFFSFAFFIHQRFFSHKVASWSASSCWLAVNPTTPNLSSPLLFLSSGGPWSCSDLVLKTDTDLQGGPAVHITTLPVSKIDSTQPVTWLSITLTPWIRSIDNTATEPFSKTFHFSTLAPANMLMMMLVARSSFLLCLLFKGIWLTSQFFSPGMRSKILKGTSGKTAFSSANCFSSSDSARTPSTKMDLILALFASNSSTSSIIAAPRGSSNVGHPWTILMGIFPCFGCSTWQPPSLVHRSWYPTSNIFDTGMISWIDCWVNNVPVTSCCRSWASPLANLTVTDFASFHSCVDLAFFKQCVAPPSSNVDPHSSAASCRTWHTLIWGSPPPPTRNDFSRCVTSAISLFSGFSTWSLTWPACPSSLPPDSSFETSGCCPSGFPTCCCCCWGGWDWSCWLFPFPPPSFPFFPPFFPFPFPPW